MSKKNWIGVLYVSVVSILLVVFSLFFFYPHGSISAFRFSSYTIDVTNLSLYEERKVEDISIDSSNKVLSFSSSALKIESYQVYEDLKSEIGFYTSEVNEEDFSSYGYLALIREGSYYSQSEVRKYSYKDGELKVVYAIEDDQLLTSNGSKNTPGVYFMDFLQLKEGWKINSINIIDKLS